MANGRVYMGALWIMIIEAVAPTFRRDAVNLESSLNLFKTRRDGETKGETLERRDSGAVQSRRTCRPRGSIRDADNGILHTSLANSDEDSDEGEERADEDGESFYAFLIPSENKIAADMSSLRTLNRTKTHRRAARLVRGEHALHADPRLRAPVILVRVVL
ncbi:hypothetical protein B0H12DRAFT_1246169 [Mycena haematopus]|nr:hypothetical protein B0H12DRAFT_1246169 [Mycena haematopus]